MEIETFKFLIHKCGCGYVSTHVGNANRHKKSACGHELITESKEFVLKEAHIAALNKTSPPGAISVADSEHINIDIDNSIDNSTHITNVNLVLPEQTTKEDFVGYLESLGQLGFRTPDEISLMPGKMLMFTRNAKKVPGALVERNNRIVEKLPDGSDRVMSKKKAVQTYTHEAVDALWTIDPAEGIADFLDTPCGRKRSKMSIRDAAKLRVTNPHDYHNRVPADVKTRHQKIENNTEKFLDKITTENKLNGFL